MKVDTKYKAIIERSKDGMYCVHSDGCIGKSYFGGFGMTQVEAMEDFKDSVAEAFRENLEIEFYFDQDNQ